MKADLVRDFTHALRVICRVSLFSLHNNSVIYSLVVVKFCCVQEIVKLQLTAQYLILDDCFSYMRFYGTTLLM